MPRRQSRRPDTASRVPWWKEYAAQIVVGVVVTATGTILPIVLTQHGTSPPTQPTPSVTIAPTFGAPCTRRDMPTSNDKGRQFNARYYCGTYVPSLVYGNVMSSQANQMLEPTGTMKQAPSVWAICQLQGRETPRFPAVLSRTPGGCTP